MKWRGEITHKDYKEIGEIEYINGFYDIKYCIEYSDGSQKIINSGL